MQVHFQLRNPTTDRRQGNPEVAAGGRETPGIDRSQQDGHRLQSIHGVPSTNERVLPETTIYLHVLGGLNRLAAGRFYGATPRIGGQTGAGAVVGSPSDAFNVGNRVFVRGLASAS